TIIAAVVVTAASVYRNPPVLVSEFYTNWQRLNVVHNVPTFISTAVEEVPTFLEKRALFRQPREIVLKQLLRDEPNDPTIQAMAYVQRCTLPGDHIATTPILMNFYYMTQRPFAGIYWAAPPGFLDGKDEEAIIDYFGKGHRPLIFIDVPGFR